MVRSGMQKTDVKRAASPGKYSKFDVLGSEVFSKVFLSDEECMGMGVTPNDDGCVDAGLSASNNVPCDVMGTNT